MKLRYIPNILTGFRILLVPAVVMLMLEDEFLPALVLFAVAGFSDAVDGYLARRYDWTSRIGGLMDPLADKLLMVSSYLTLGWLGLIPSWLVALVIGVLFMVVAWVLPRFPGNRSRSVPGGLPVH